jgi:hypothetical protein
MRAELDLPTGYAYENGFIKQVDQHRIVYDDSYKAKQSTNVEMSYLRMGFMCAYIPYEKIKEMSMVDVGSGNGIFANCCRGKFKEVCEYDVVGENVISRDDLYSRTWGLVVLSDVLEHFENINDLFLMKWEYCLLSFPETPDVASFFELMGWRHFKPGEHLYHLYRDGVVDWINRTKPDAVVVAWSNVEDLIRKRWNEALPNITTLLIRRTIC